MSRSNKEPKRATRARAVQQATEADGRRSQLRGKIRISTDRVSIKRGRSLTEIRTEAVIRPEE